LGSQPFQRRKILLRTGVVGQGVNVKPGSSVCLISVDVTNLGLTGDDPSDLLLTFP